MNEKLCDERHERIEKMFDKINEKLDIVIENRTTIKNFWKFVSVFLVIVGLVIGALKLLT